MMSLKLIDNGKNSRHGDTSPSISCSDNDAAEVACGESRTKEEAMAESIDKRFSDSHSILKS